jgi:hypothetical protein
MPETVKLSRNRQRQLLIQRMIKAGYSDEDIDNRIRCSIELAAAIRRVMGLEERRE